MDAKRTSPFYDNKIRWLFSAFCTSFLLILALALPTWNFQLSGSNRESKNESAVSIVTVVKKASVAAPPQKTEPKIPAKKNPPLPKKQKINEKVKKQAAVEQSVPEAQSDENQKIDEKAEITENTESAENAKSEANAEPQSQAESGTAQEPVLSDSQRKALANYKSYVLGRIASKKKYPYSARSQGLEGKVRVRLTINSDGKLIDTELLQECDHEVLNEACLTAIKKSAPFKKMPDGQESLTVTFVMDFSLKEK